MFIGAFNKQNGFCERTWAYEKYGLQYDVDSRQFSQVVKRITSIIGSKTVYTVQDAYRYFHAAYRAFQIDYRQYYNYCSTDTIKFLNMAEPTISDDCDIEVLAEESGRFFAYLRNGQFTGEKPLTLVIDSSCLHLPSGEVFRDNLTLVIGSFDGVQINSMKVIFNPNFWEIEYALEFFRLHS